MTSVLWWIFNDCCISITHISGPNRLTIEFHKNTFFGSNWNIFLDLRYVPLRYDERLKFATIFLNHRSMIWEETQKRPKFKGCQICSSMDFRPCVVKWIASLRGPGMCVNAEYLWSVRTQFSQQCLVRIKPLYDNYFSTLTSKNMCLHFTD